MLNPVFFAHNQRYKLFLENGDFYHFRALQYDKPAPESINPSTSVFGVLLLIDERFEFELRTDYFSLENIQRAESIHALTMLSECMGFIASDHNQYVLESTGLTPDGNRPMAISQKPRENWISLAAAYFSEKDVRRFGVLEKMVWGTYLITSSDEVQPGGVCLQVRLSLTDQPDAIPSLLRDQPITAELLEKYGFTLNALIQEWELPEPDDPQVSLLGVHVSDEEPGRWELQYLGSDEHPDEHTKLTGFEHLLEKLSEYGYDFEEQPTAATDAPLTA